MLHYKIQSVFILIVLLTTGILASCQNKIPLATPSAPGISVGITDDLCPGVTLQAGQQVTWTNQGVSEHVVRDITIEGSSQFDSGILKSGDTFAFTFPQAKKYTYECSEDGLLTGVITVES